MWEQGPIEMWNSMTDACRVAGNMGASGRCRTGLAAAGMAAVLAFAGLTTTSGRVWAQQPELSQKSVETLMEYAWAITPDRFTKPNGQTVEIDRANRKTVEVPFEAAREIIRVGRLSAHAQVCDLKEEHALNFRTMMARENNKKKWSEAQMVFMNQLHMVTVMLLTGQLKLIEREEGKEAAVSEDWQAGVLLGGTESQSERGSCRLSEGWTDFRFREFVRSWRWGSRRAGKRAGSDARIGTA